MTTATEALPMEARLEALSEKLQVLVDEAEERRRRRETYTDLIHDLSPMASQGMGSLTRAMTEAEERGYIGFAKSGLGVVDRVVTAFSDEDVAALGDNIVLILETVKEMTQPEVMQMMRATFHQVGEIEEPETPPSMFEIVRQMRDPEVRRGLARLMGLLKSMGSVDQTDVMKRKEGRE